MVIDFKALFVAQGTCPDRYHFPRLPKCAMDAYEIARDFITCLSRAVVKVLYASYCGIGVMYESGSVIVELNDSHRHELGISAAALDSEKVQLFTEGLGNNCEDFSVQVPSHLQNQ